MGFDFGSIVELLGIIISSVLPFVLKNNLWDDNVPKTIEEFNEKYEDKIKNILKDNLFESSNVLGNIIDNRLDPKIDFSGDKEKSAQYTKIIAQHEPFFINIKKHIEIENMINDVEETYFNLNNIIPDINNLSWAIVILGILAILCILFFNNASITIYILCILYSSIVCCIFRVARLYFKFKVFIKKIIFHKNWILEHSKSIKRLSDDYYEN